VPVVVQRPVVGRGVEVAPGGEDEHPGGREPAGQEVEQLQRRRVGPLEVLKDHHQRPVVGGRQDHRGELVQELEAGRGVRASINAGFSRVFWTLVLPLVRPALGALAIWNFLGVYNSFLWPLVVMSSNDKLMLPVGLAQIYGNYSREYGLVMGGAVLAAIPMIVVFVVRRGGWSS